MCPSSTPKLEKVGVIGVGRLGLCVALCLDRAGYEVVGVDISESYVKALNDKTFSSKEPSVNEFLKSSKCLLATTDLKYAADNCKYLYIMVDTPSTGGDRHYDVSKLGRVLIALNEMRLADKHVIIGCTVLPGYTRQIGRELLKDCQNVTLSYSPEFIQQGDIIQGFLNPDMVLIGEETKEAGDFLQAMYETVCLNSPHIARMSAESAEICKLAVNCFVTTKISFANMIGDIADSTPGADKYDILGAVGADSRVGGKCLKPGFGFGGPCFPRDNRALGGYATSVGVEPLVSIATDDYNKYHTEKMVEQQLATGKTKFVFSDVAYKPGCAVAIIEESQKLAVAAGIARAGKKVTISDRDFIIDLVRAEHGSLFSYECV